MLKERVALVRNWSYFHLLVFFNVGRQTLFDLKVILLFSTVKSACLRISYHYLAENWRFPTTNGRTKSFNQCRTGLFWFLWPISSSLKDVSFVAVQTATKGRPIRATQMDMQNHFGHRLETIPGGDQFPFWETRAWDLLPGYERYLFVWFGHLILVPLPLLQDWWWWI